VDGFPGAPRADARAIQSVGHTDWRGGPPVREPPLGTTPRSACSRPLGRFQPATAATKTQTPASARSASGCPWEPAAATCSPKCCAKARVWHYWASPLEPRARLLAARSAGLPRDSVVNVFQLPTLGRGFLTERAGTLPARLQRSVDEGLRTVLQL
jgi:hypothetical protein